MTLVHTYSNQTELKMQCLALLERWAAHAEKTWTWLSPSDATRFAGRRKLAANSTQYTPSEPVAGYYGTGYASWGVMAQAATVGVFGALATATNNKDYLERCSKGMRFLFGTHAAGPLVLTDGAKWGSGVSGYDEQYAALWLEQGMLAYDLVEQDLAPYDRALVKSVLTSEVDHYLAQRVNGGLGPDSGRAETNAWKAAVLARAATLYPQHPRAEQWRQKSCLFWLNSLSVENDAYSAVLARGRPIRDWHRTANCHAHFGVTHRGFFHPSDIALTLAVMAHTALMHARRNVPIPAESFHHWHDALAVIKQLFLWDGTVACVGGQTWPRYTWDQTMLLPTLAWAGAHAEAIPAGDEIPLRPEQALTMFGGILNHIAAEQHANGDGSFFSQRLSSLRENAEWEYLRYESGTAFALATAYAMFNLTGTQSKQRSSGKGLAQRGTQLHTVTQYREASLGTVWQRSPYRFASWCWQACHVPAQGLVIPRSGMRLAEWNSNLVGAAQLREHEEYHALQYHREHQFAGGFATLGLLAEQLPMWHMADKTPSLRHGLAFWALPDGRTCLLLDLVWNERQVNILQNKGVIYKVANDITNGNIRTFTCAHGERKIVGVGAQPEVWRPNSPWLVVEDCLFMMPCWGGGLAVNIRGERLRGLHGNGDASLLWDEICTPFSTKSERLSAGETIRDVCTVYVCEVSGAEGAQTAAKLKHKQLTTHAPHSAEPHARAALVTDRSATEYLIAANFDRETITVDLPSDWRPVLLAGDTKPQQGQLRLPPASLTLCVRDS